MLEKMSKGKKILFLFSLFFTSMIAIGDQGIMPFVYDMYAAFPDHALVVSYISSAGALFIIFGSILATLMLKKTSKRSVIIFSCALFTFSTIACMLKPLLPVMVICRSLMGLGEGAISVAVMALLAEIYLDEDKKAVMVGYYNAVMTVFGAVLAAGSGMLAANGWQKGFFIYLPAVVMLVMVLFFVPNTSPAESQTETYENAGADETASGGFGKRYWIFLFNYVLFTIGFAAFSYFVSTYVVETNLGSSTLAGNGLAVVSITGLFACLAFGKIYQKLHGKTAIPCLIMGIISLGLMGFCPSVATLFLACAIMGVGYGIYYSLSFTYVAAIVHYTKIDDAIGILNTFYGLAYFCSTFIVSALMNITDGKITPVFLILGVILILPLILEIISGVHEK